jgi:hypothetical protein
MWMRLVYKEPDLSDADLCAALGKWMRRLATKDLYVQKVADESRSRRIG